MSIADHLKKKGMNSTDLAKEMDVSRTTAHRIKTGQLFSRILPYFQKIYTATGLTPNEVLNIPEDKNITETTTP
jgi:DNA-binding Xre family transcriptional regulator